MQNFTSQLLRLNNVNLYALYSLPTQYVRHVWKHNILTYAHYISWKVSQNLS